MQRIIPAISRVPELLSSIFQGPYAPLAFVLTIVYIIILFLNNKVTRMIREIMVPVAAGTAVFGYFKRKYDLTWLMIILLAILIVVSLLKFLLGTIRLNYKNRRIEKRALEKARMRRGSWKDKKGFSGERVYDDEPPEFKEMADRELQDVVMNETVDNQGAKIDLTVAPPPVALPDPAEEMLDDSHLTRDAAMNAITMLEKLHDLGVLTDDELETKRADLYERMG